MAAETTIPGIHTGATVIKHWWECYTCGECPDAVEDERAEAAAHTTKTGHTTSYHRSEGRYLMPKRDNTGPPADVIAGPRTEPLADQVGGYVVQPVAITGPDGKDTGQTVFERRPVT